MFFSGRKFGSVVQSVLQVGRPLAHDSLTHVDWELGLLEILVYCFLSLN